VSIASGQSIANEGETRIKDGSCGLRFAVQAIQRGFCPLNHALDTLGGRSAATEGGVFKRIFGHPLYGVDVRPLYVARGA
jgi:hypothetical protein